MEFKHSVSMELSGQELATVWVGLMKLPGELTYDLLKRIEMIEAMAADQNSKPQLPPMKMVSAS